MADHGRVFHKVQSATLVRGREAYFFVTTNPANPPYNGNRVIKYEYLNRMHEGERDDIDIIWPGMVRFKDRIVGLAQRPDGSETFFLLSEWPGDRVGFSMIRYNDDQKDAIAEGNGVQYIGAPLAVLAPEVIRIEEELQPKSKLKHAHDSATEESRDRFLSDSVRGFPPAEVTQASVDRNLSLERIKDRYSGSYALFTFGQVVDASFLIGGFQEVGLAFPIGTDDLGFNAIPYETHGFTAGYSKGYDVSKSAGLWVVPFEDFLGTAHGITYGLSFGEGMSSTYWFNFRDEFIGISVGLQTGYSIEFEYVVAETTLLEKKPSTYKGSKLPWMSQSFMERGTTVG